MAGTPLGARADDSGLTPSGVIPKSVFETTGMPAINVPTLSSVPFFAFVMVSDKIHLAENSTDLIF